MIYYASLMENDIYNQELPNFFRPYDSGDLEKHRVGRRFRQILQHIHTENWDLIEYIERVIDILENGREGILIDIAQRFIPGEKGTKNPSCYYLQRLAERMIAYGEGGCPKTRVIIYASRSTAMLIECLMRVHPSEHLSKAWRMAKRLFELMIYDGKPTMSREEYATLVKSLAKEFIAACVANADELSPYLCEKIELRKAEQRKNAEMKKLGEKVDASVRIAAATHKLVRRVDAKVAKIGKRERAKNLKQVCLDYWLAAHGNKALKESVNTKLTHSVAYEHYKSELNALGVTSFEAFDKALNNFSKNSSRDRIKELEAKKSGG